MKKEVICYVCGNSVKKDDKALNLKLVRHDLTRFMCRSCLSGALEVPLLELDDLVKRFREEGCTLFH